MAYRDTSDKIEELTGVVEGIVYYNDDNGYAVCYIQTQDQLATVVGYLPMIAEGEQVSVSGKWGYHSEYGEQFQALYFEKVMPSETADILRYLSSGIVKGVRAATAQKLVDRFGERTLAVIAGEPHRLTEITGISAKKAEEISKSYTEQIGVKELVVFVQRYGISAGIAAKIYQLYGLSGINVIKTNPYAPVREIHGYTFAMADKMASAMGMPGNCRERIRAGVFAVLSEAATEGHTYQPRADFAGRVASYLHIDGQEADSEITSMLIEGELTVKHLEEEAIYLPYYLQAEVDAAARLRMLCEKESLGDPDKLLEQAEKQQGITLAAAQREAVRTALTQKLTVITGGPGTGKTTIVNTILQVMRSLGKEVALCAPTGRAAKRMSEVCGAEAKTIHRLLGCEYSEDKQQMTFSRNADNPLTADLIIVDEVSMVDILLMDSLLKAIRRRSRLILVGDSDQLPSVGAGNVLYDIIRSGTVPVAALDEIYRQAQESMIVVNAHRINHGELPLCNLKDKDFFLVEREEGEEIVETVVDLCVNRLQKAYGFDPKSQIQVLSPMRKGVTGVSVLNERLQQRLNPPSADKQERKSLGTVFRVGDKVMQIRNNYNITWRRVEDDEEGTGIFNGDIGYVTEIDAAQEQMKVLFDEDKLVSYHFQQLDELVLAYAVTVHKSQGSEFDAVIMPLFPTAPMLQNRKLFYTAVTRARRLVVLVGRNYVMGRYVDNKSERRRYTGLYSFLQEEAL